MTPHHKYHKHQMGQDVIELGAGIHSMAFLVLYTEGLLVVLGHKH